MSKYRTIETEFKDEATLIKALTDVCETLGGELVSSNANDVALYGFQGYIRKERVKFAVRRSLIGSAANDLGFVQAADGSFQVVISDWDSKRAEKGYGLHVLNQVKERYNFHNVQTLAWQQGYSVFETTNDVGEVVLQLSRTF